MFSIVMGDYYDMLVDEWFVFKLVMCLKIYDIFDDNNGRVGDFMVLYFFMDIVKCFFYVLLLFLCFLLNDEYRDGRGFFVFYKFLVYK